ncbi:MAG: glycoside hydrolase family 3 C-terminal domain-containing protein [Anaerolineales bacterium]
MKTRKQIEQQVESLLAQMTLAEKVALLSGRDVWHTVPIERLGIPSIVMTDGPHGVRAADPATGRKIGPATAFPTGISMGACWNPELVEQVGRALGEEARGMDCDILLGPCVNIVRDPRGGRNFETFAEDPYLAGRTAAAYIRGVQSRGVGTSLKHYAVNNYEIERLRASSEVDERTLREIYLAQFEMAVKESQPWTVMCAYNRVNGVYASQHDYLLNKILREEWGFEGAVISDWGANHTIFESIAGGLDLEMPGPARYYKLLADAVQNWQIPAEAVEAAARRVLRLIVQSGRMDGKRPKGAVNTPAHQALARRLAEEAITLLKNDGRTLPLEDIRSLAVIGPNAAEAVIQGGGSSRVPAPYRVSPLEALQKKLGKKVRLEYEQGCDNFDEPHDVPSAWLSGLRLRAYAASDFSGKPMREQDGLPAEMWYHTGWSAEPIKPQAFCWEGSLTLPADGLYRFFLRHSGAVRLWLDGQSVLESRPSAGGRGEAAETTTALKAGKHALRLELIRPLSEEIVFFKLGLARTFEAGRDPRRQRALELASRCDAVVFFGGYPEAFESEGWDREHIRLLGGQDELIAALAEVNPRTAVVLNVGAPVTMPWAEKVGALLLAYYPGQENGNAVASVLLGEVNPSGKLPVTFPRRLEDSPAFLNAAYPGCRQVRYGEGIFVGYRYYDARQMEPLFPFGHGLSYTTFEYGGLKLPEKVRRGQPVVVTLTVTNTGRRAGKEVVQLYLADLQSSLPRPPKELKGFAKVALAAGQSQTVTFTLDERALSFYDPVQARWVAEAGEFEVLVGSSSRHIRLRGRFTLTD